MHNITTHNKATQSHAIYFWVNSFKQATKYMYLKLMLKSMVPIELLLTKYYLKNQCASLELIIIKIILTIFYQRECKVLTKCTTKHAKCTRWIKGDKKLCGFVKKCKI